MLYPYYQQVDRDVLESVPLPLAEEVGMGNRWRGVSHGLLANTIVHQATLLGLNVVDESWQLSPKKYELFGSLDFEIPDIQAPEGTRFSLGIRHSNAGKYAVTFAVGAKVMVCSNGLFYGSFILSKKHTSGLDLDVIVADGLKRYVGQLQGVSNFITYLQGSYTGYLAPNEVEYLMMESANLGIIPWSLLKDVYDEWQKGEGPDDAWSLYNAYTECIKRYTPDRQLKMLTGITNLIAEAVDYRFE